MPTPTPHADPDADPDPPPGRSATLLAAGDIAGCSSSGDEATAKLLDGLAGTVATLGDNVYESGTASEFSQLLRAEPGAATRAAPARRPATTST